MHSKLLGKMILAFLSTTYAWAQQLGSCANLANFKAENVEITKAAAIAAGTTEAIPWNQTRSAPLPAYCRVEGVMNRRTGVDGEEFGITKEQCHELLDVSYVISAEHSVLLFVLHYYVICKDLSSFLKVIADLE